MAMARVQEIIIVPSSIGRVEGWCAYRINEYLDERMAEGQCLPNHQQPNHYHFKCQ